MDAYCPSSRTPPPPTNRGTSRFGSTEKTETLPMTPLPTPPICITPTIASAATMVVEDNPILTFPIIFFENEPLVTIANSGDYPSRGLDVTICDKLGCVKLLACNKGTPAGKISKWRYVLCDSYILQCNEQPVSNIHSLYNIISSCTGDTFTILFGTVEKQALHPQTGVPQL